MKKWFTLSTICLIVLVLIAAPSCTKETKKGKSQGVLNLLPASTKGFLSVNIDSFAGLDVFGSMIDEFDKEWDKKDEIFKDYQDFVTRTGIDLKKDLHQLTFGFFAELDLNPMTKGKEIVVIVTLDYDKDKLLKLMSEEKLKYTEEDYKGIKVYLIQDKKSQNQVLSFLKPDTLLLGSAAQVKTVIDVFKGERDNIFKSEKWKSYLADYNSGTLGSFMFEFPETIKEKSNADQDSPFSVDLSKAELLKGFFDYKNNTWLGEIILISHNKEGNKKTVDLLNNLKGMGAIAGEEVAELLNNISLVSSDDRIKLSVSIHKDLFEKLKAKAKDKLMTNPVLDNETEQETEQEL